MASDGIEQLIGVDTVAHHDQAAWDTAVAAMGGQPFQSWAWGKLKSHFGWQPFRLSAVDGSCAAQVLIRPYRGLAVAYVPRGPVTAVGATTDPALLEAIARLARSQRCAFVRVEPDVVIDDNGAPQLDQALRNTGFKPSQRTLQPRSSIRLDLTVPTNQLLAGFSKGHRADIRRAERDGVTIRAGTSEDEIDLLHDMLRATQERKAFRIHSAPYYRVLWRAFGDTARLLIAEHDGQVVAASLNLAFGGHGTYLVAGSTAAGLEHRAAHLLQWHAIRWAKERGAQTWDLWGIADARGRYELALAAGEDAQSPEMTRLEADARRDPLDGVYRFKKGWGGTVVRTIPAYDRVFIRPAYWYWQWRRGEA